MPHAHDDPRIEAEIQELIAEEKFTEACERIVQVYGSLLLRFCIRQLRIAGISNDPESAGEDIVQIAFVKFFQALQRRQYKPSQGSIGQYLFGIARNECSSTHRKYRTLKAREGDPTRDPEDDQGTPEDRLIVKETWEAILKFPDIYRQVMILTCLEGLSRAETAAKLGISPGNVGTRLHRAREMLREQFPDDI